MSVYKVISNYYTDLLNFLSEEDKKYNGLKNMFQDMTPDKKKIIVTKLSEMMLRFDTAFKNEISYWQQNKKEQTFFNALYWIILIILFVLTVMMYIFKMKEIKEEGGNIFQHGKSLLTFIIGYQIILSVFVLLMINVKNNKKLCNGQIQLLKEDLRFYSNYVFIGGSQENLATVFSFIGYWRRNNKSNAKALSKDLQRDTSLSPIVNLFPITNDSKSKVKDDDSGNTNIIGKEIEVYDLLKEDIQNSLKKFYNDGEGYIDIKKLLLLSNPIMMLKEVKRIMYYYNNLGYRKVEDSKASTDKKDKDVIRDVVVTPILNLLQNAMADGNNVSDADLNNAVILNEGNDKFKESMDNLITGYVYLAVFCLPIYTKSAPESYLERYMPQNIDINSTSTKFLQGVKTAFSKVYNNDYKTIFAEAQKIDDSTPLIEDLVKNFIPMFNDLYYRVFANLEGSVWFPFNKTYITSNILQKLQNVPGSYLPDDYKKKFVNIVYQDIVGPVSSSFDIIQVKRSELINDISTALVPLNIDILKYQNYVVNLVIESNKSAQKFIDEINDLMTQIQKSLTNKRELFNNEKLANDYKYKDYADFTSLVDTLSYQEFKENLQVNYFEDVVDKFYSAISESVNMKKPNLRNIYYKRQNSLKLWKVVVIMLIITLILFMIRFLAGVVEEKSNIKYVKPQKDCDKPFAMNDYMNRNANWYIKLILPIFIVIFLIAMLIAFKKKMEASFEFNLEIIENNTNELKSALSDLSTKLDDIDSRLDMSQMGYKIGILDKITVDDKKDLLENIKKVIDKYEKCNYIIESGKNQVPFPYAEVVMHGFMLLLSVIAVIYVLVVFGPLSRIKDIKYMNKLKEELQFSTDISSFSQKMTSISMCHNEAMEGLVFSMKIIFFFFILMFLMFYSVKIISTANDFKSGLYNSSYFEDSRCYDSS